MPISYCLVIDSFHYNSKVMCQVVSYPDPPPGGSGFKIMCQHTYDRLIVLVQDQKPTPAQITLSIASACYTESDVCTGWGLGMRLCWPTGGRCQIKSCMALYYTWVTLDIHVVIASFPGFPTCSFWLSSTMQPFLHSGRDKKLDDGKALKQDWLGITCILLYTYMYLYAVCT